LDGEVLIFGENQRSAELFGRKKGDEKKKKCKMKVRKKKETRANESKRENLSS